MSRAGGAIFFQEIELNHKQSENKGRFTEMPNLQMPGPEHKPAKDDLSVINDVRKKALKLISSLHILSGDNLLVIDFDPSKARHLIEFKYWPNFHEEILQEGRELAEALSKDFFGAATRIVKYGTEVENKCMKEACWNLSTAVRQFKHSTQGMPDFKEVADQLNSFDEFEESLLDDLAKEVERKEANKMAKIGLEWIWKAIKLKLGIS